MKITIPEKLNDSVIISRVRLARNLSGTPFYVDNPILAKEIIGKVDRALKLTEQFNLYRTAELTALELESMKERHLISNTLIENKLCGAVLINEDESVSVMINEEDVLREQCFLKGLSLNEAYKRIQVIDDELNKNLNLAFDEKFGYLTACPTNLGTGLRASVMMFLPALTEGGKIKPLVKEVKKLGLTVRGAYGEGSEAEGFIYQISNEVTLGVSEYDILREVENTVDRIRLAERDEMVRLYTGKNELSTMDKILKSYGILTHSVLLEYSEFLRHVSWVKLGAILGVIPISDIYKIDKLIVAVRPANLCIANGKRLSSVERDYIRAQMVGDKLRKLRG